MQAQTILPPLMSNPCLSSVIATVNNLQKSFAGKVALNKLTLSIQANQVLAVLGANGAGKTTLINILLGRMQADSGEISIFGSQAVSLPSVRLARCCKWQMYLKR